MSTSSSVEHSTKSNKTNGIKRKYEASSRASSSKSFPYDKNNVSRNTQSQVKTFRKTYKEISPDAQMLVDQILDPEVQMSATRIPTFGVSATYTAHNILESRYDVNGISCVTVYPSLNNSIYATAGEQLVQPLSVLGGVNNPYVTQPISVAPLISDRAAFSQPFMFTNKHVVLPKPSSVGGAMIYPLAHAGPLATSPLVAHFQLSDVHSATDLQAVVRYYDAAETLLTINNTVFNNSGVSTIQLFSNVSSAGAQWLAFEVQQAGGGGIVPFEGFCTLQLTDPTGLDPGILVRNQSQHCLSFSLNGARNIGQSAETYMVTAQSLLLTYEGSDLNSGGRLAIGRIPQNTVVGQPGGNAGAPTFDSWYDWIASLSRNSYNSRVKSGGYAFYLGQDDRSYFYRPVEEVHPPELPYLAAEWSTEAATPQAVRIMVTTIVQFSTNSNIYDQAPSPYLGEDWCKILHILSNIGAAYDNPGHRKKLADALKKIGGKVVGLLKDPQTYMTMGKIAAMLAAV